MERTDHVDAVASHFSIAAAQGDVDPNAGFDRGFERRRN